MKRFTGKSAVGNAARLVVLLLGLCWAAAASGQDLKVLRAPQKVAFPNGYNIVNGQGKVLKELPDERSANIQAYADFSGERHYMSDWSYQRYRDKRVKPNWIRARVEASPPATTDGSRSKGDLGATEVETIVQKPPPPTFLKSSSLSCTPVTAVSHTKRIVATSHGGFPVRIWSLDKHALLREIPVSADVITLRFMPDGEHLLVLTQPRYGSLRLTCYTLASGKKCGELEPDFWAKMIWAYLSADGNSLFLTGENGMPIGEIYYSDISHIRGRKDIGNVKARRVSANFVAAKAPELRGVNLSLDSLDKGVFYRGWLDADRIPSWALLGTRHESVTENDPTRWRVTQAYKTAVADLEVARKLRADWLATKPFGPGGLRDPRWHRERNEENDRRLAAFDQSVLNAREKIEGNSSLSVSNMLALSADGDIFAAYSKGSITFIDSTWGSARSLVLQDQIIISCALSPDGKRAWLFTVPQDRVRIEREFAGPSAQSLRIEPEPHVSAKLISTDDVRVLDTVKLKELGSMAMGPYGETISVAWDGRCVVIDNRHQARVDSGRGDEGWQACLVFSSKMEFIRKIVGGVLPESARHPLVCGVLTPEKKLQVVDALSGKAFAVLSGFFKRDETWLQSLRRFEINREATYFGVPWSWRGGCGGFFVGNETKGWDAYGERPGDWNSFIGERVLLCAETGNGAVTRVSILDLSKERSLRFRADIPSIRQRALDSERRVLLGYEISGAVVKYKITDKGLVLMGRYYLGGDEVLVCTQDNEYARVGGGGGPVKNVRFAVGLDTYPFEQFDLRLNRPDIVLERLGAPAEAVTMAKELRSKRLKRMKVSEDMLKPDFHVPELSIVGEVPQTSSSDTIIVPVRASDSRFSLERLKVYVNNVPVNGRDGESLRALSVTELERRIPVKLASGRNKIQISVVNSAGAESLYANLEVICTAVAAKPVLYTVALGVSSYGDPEFDLRYAAKDAEDITATLHDGPGEHYRAVRSLCLTDKEVTREALPRIREFLSLAGVNDTLVFYVAGHGMLDASYDYYYYATADMDFGNPGARGIAFDEFDGIMAGVRCLKKTMWIDTCHAGELDEEERTLLAANSGAGAASLPGESGVAMRAVGKRGMSVRAIERGQLRSEWYERLQGLFVDLRRGSGTTVLTSSAGAEYAFESSKQRNGLFTYALIEALRGEKAADADQDGSITMSEAANYVKKRVGELSNGKQNPTVRRVNLEGDFKLHRKRGN